MAGGGLMCRLAAPGGYDRVESGAELAKDVRPSQSGPVTNDWDVALA